MIEDKDNLLHTLAKCIEDGNITFKVVKVTGSLKVLNVTIKDEYGAVLLDNKRLAIFN